MSIETLRERARIVAKIRALRGAAESSAQLLPVARIIDDNQMGATAIVAIVCDPPTLGVGTLLYSRPLDHSAELVEAYQAGIRAASVAAS